MKVVKLIYALNIFVLLSSCGGNNADPLDTILDIAIPVPPIEAEGPVSEEFVSVITVSICTVMVNGLIDSVSPCVSAGFTATDTGNFVQTSTVLVTNSAYVPPISSAEELQVFMMDNFSNVTSSRIVSFSVDSNSPVTTDTFDVLVENKDGFGANLAIDYGEFYAISSTFVSPNVDYIISTGVNVRPEILANSLTFLAGTQRIESRSGYVSTPSYGQDISLTFTVYKSDDVTVSDGTDTYTLNSDADNIYTGLIPFSTFKSGHVTLDMDLNFRVLFDRHIMNVISYYLPQCTEIGNLCGDNGSINRPVGFSLSLNLGILPSTMETIGKIEFERYSTTDSERIGEPIFTIYNNTFEAYLASDIVQHGQIEYRAFAYDLNGNRSIPLGTIVVNGECSNGQVFAPGLGCQPI